MKWIVWVALTVLCWGTYGLLLHTGQVSMQDRTSGRYKAFLFVGVAYMLVAVAAPIAMLIWQKSDWHFTAAGAGWSLLAGIAGALGAFGVLLAFGAGGSPAAVMSLVFCGAPLVNAALSLLLHPPAGGLGRLPWPFVLGVLLAAAGGALVTLYKPALSPPLAHAPPAAPQPPHASSQP